MPSSLSVIAHFAKDQSEHFVCHKWTWFMDKLIYGLVDEFCDLLVW